MLDAVTLSGRSRTLLHKVPWEIAGEINRETTSDQHQASELPDERKEVLDGSYHPWRRLFARTVDMLTIGLLAVLVIAFGLGILFPSKAAALSGALENQIIGGFFVLTLWIPLEAIFLSTVGTTPARWLFGISVKTANGGKLSFYQGLHRSFLVAFRGMALGIPIVAFLTQIFAYRRLTRTGTTSWDTAANSVVTHKTWGAGRAFVCVVSVFFVLVLISILNVVGKVIGK